MSRSKKTATLVSPADVPTRTEQIKEKLKRRSPEQELVVGLRPSERKAGLSAGRRGVLAGKSGPPLHQFAQSLGLQQKGVCYG